MSPGTPSDWVSGERVFAPPPGTVDVDWLVPAVLELAPGAAPAQARAALQAAWLRRRASAARGTPGPGGARGADAARPAPVGASPAGSGPLGDVEVRDEGTTGDGVEGGDEVELDVRSAAERVIAEALATFGG